MKSYLAALLCTTLAASTFAAEGKWTEGFGQGNLEYFIDQIGARLYIGCPTQDGDPNASSSVSLSQVKNGIEAKSFTLQVGGLSFQGPFDTGSRVGANNFIALIDGLRKTDAVVKIGNQSITFPKSNALKVLPSGKKLKCNLQ